MSRLSFAVATSLVLAVAAAPTAQAGTTTTIGTGVDCAHAYTEEGGVTHSHDGGIYSFAAGGWRSAVCPIRQPTPYLLNSTASISVIDQSYDLDVMCRIIMSPGGPWQSWGAAATSTGSSPYTQRIAVSFNNGVHQQGRELILCYLPPVYAGNRTGLISYEATHTTLM